MSKELRFASSSNALQYLADYINKTIKIAAAEDDYLGEHSAPTKENGAPIYNVEGIYPKDIYEGKGSQYVSISFDNEGLNIILNCRNKPNARITIYRAVPDINKEAKEKRDVIQNAKQSLIALKDHRVIKTSDEAKKIIYGLKDKYPIEKYDYDQQQDLMIEDLEKQLDQLESELKDNIKIEKGNWVSPSKAYAVDHGKSNLNGKYKIISKTVRAKDLYTDGNSFSEWGYDPQ